MKQVEELLEMMGNYMPSLSNFPIYIIIFAIITILLGAIFTKQRWIKFIPGPLAMIYGTIKGLNAWKNFAQEGALDDAWMAIIFFMSGVISFCTALILHMYISNDKKKSKKKEEIKRDRYDNNYRKERKNNLNQDKTRVLNKNEIKRKIDDKTKVIGKKFNSIKDNIGNKIKETKKTRSISKENIENLDKNGNKRPNKNQISKKIDKNKDK